MPNCVFIECSKIYSKILVDKNIIAIFGVIGQNFGPVYSKKYIENSYTVKWILNIIMLRKPIVLNIDFYYVCCYISYVQSYMYLS